MLAEPLSLSTILEGPYIAPAICCEQLKETITHDLKCLCGILAHTDVLKSFNITQVELMKLRKDCAINLTQSVCKVAPRLDLPPM
ncbi:hypothetical protein CFP56_018103, partial [Quercus suber]